MTLNTLSLKTYLVAESLFEHRLTQIALVGAFCYTLMEPSFAAINDADTMKASVVELQKQIFGSGWVTIGKIAAAAVGAVMAVARSSAVPFAMGAAVSGGLHFFHKHTETAAGCLF